MENTAGGEDNPQDILQYLQQCEREDRARLDELNTMSQTQPQDDVNGHHDHYEPEYNRHQNFNISNGLLDGCMAENCSQNYSLSRCAACKAVKYCSRDHQVADRPKHRSRCSKTKKAMAHMDKEERALKRTEGDDVFVRMKGHFWGLWETRDYMRARYGVVQELMKVNTIVAVTATLEHLLDMLQLCRSDNMGVRDVTPAVYLRLGFEQECYDFCKWWATVAQQKGYDSGEMGHLFLNTKDEDVFEDTDLFTRKYASLSHAVAITLLKIRLMMDLQALERARQDAGIHVPREILDEINRSTTKSNVAKMEEILKSDDHGLMLLKLKGQVEELHAAVKRSNKHFWPALLDPKDDLTKQPMHYSPGDKCEMQLVLQYSYNAWKETAGAIGVIRLLERQ